LLKGIFALNSINFFNGNIWSLLTSMFLHAGFFHLFRFKLWVMNIRCDRVSVSIGY
jgi:membrane associated rhomboid family serine protease